MISKKLLLPIFLTCLVTGAQQNPFTTVVETAKQANEAIDETIKKTPGGDYAWLITGTILLVGAIYLYKTQSRLSGLSNHEFLQTRFLHLVQAMNTYQNYIDDLHFNIDPHNEVRIQHICERLQNNHRNNPSQLLIVLRTVQRLKETLTTEQTEVENRLETLRGNQEFELLTSNEQLFSNYYDHTISTLEQLEKQIPYVQGLLFLEAKFRIHNVTGQVEEYLTRVEDFSHNNAYPVRAYAAHVAADVSHLSRILNNLEHFVPQPFQENHVPKFQRAHTIISQERDRIRASEAYARETRACLAEQERQRRLAALQARSPYRYQHPAHQSHQPHFGYQPIGSSAQLAPGQAPQAGLLHRSSFACETWADLAPAPAQAWQLQDAAGRSRLNQGILIAHLQRVNQPSALPVGIRIE